MFRACPACVALIRYEESDSLIDRIIAAYTALQFIPDKALRVFRYELRSAFEQQSESEETTPARIFFFFPAMI